jgi:secreted trypsin-like serine protease
MKLNILAVALTVVLGVSSSPLELEQDFSPFIINGVRSTVTPYFAFIQYFNNQGMGFFGGGALISTRHILTAATNVHG